MGQGGGGGTKQEEGGGQVKFYPYKKKVMGDQVEKVLAIQKWGRGGAHNVLR